MSEYSEVQTGEIPFVNLSVIAERSVEEELQEKLKPATFGGYSKGSVAQYTKELKSSLEQMRVNLEQQIKDLVAEKGNLSQECSLLRSQLSDAEKRVAQLQRESQERERKVEQIMEEMNLKVQNLDHDNETLRRESAKVKEAKAEFEHLKRRLQTKEDEVGSLTVQLEKSQRLCDELKSRIQELESIPKLPSADASELERLKKENGFLSGRLQEAEQRSQTLQEKLARETEASSEKLRVVENRSKQFQASLVKLEENQSEHHLQFEKEYMEKLDMAYRALQEAKEEKNGLLSQIEKQNKANAGLTEKLSLLQNRFVGVQNQNVSLKEEKSTLEERITQNHQQQREQGLLKEQNESLCRDMVSMKAGVKDILSQMELQKSMILDIVSRTAESFAGLQKKLQSLIQEKTDLQGRNVKLMEQITNLTASLSAAELEKAKLQKKFSLQDMAGFAGRTAPHDIGTDSVRSRTDEPPKPAADVLIFDKREDGGLAETVEFPSVDAARNRAFDITHWLARNTDEIRTKYAIVRDAPEIQKEGG